MQLPLTPVCFLRYAQEQFPNKTLSTQMAILQRLYKYEPFHRIALRQSGKGSRNA